MKGNKILVFSLILTVSLSLMTAVSQAAPAPQQAKKAAQNRNLREEFEALGIQVRASTFATVAEEIPDAYKDVAEVVDVVDRAGIGRKVARLKPMGVLKG